jgi:hypothetical protein
MKNSILLFSIILASILLFGCVGDDSTQQQTQQQTGNATQGTGNGQQGTDAGAQDTFDATSATSYSLAVAAGVPLECTAVVNGETTKYYVKGDKLYISGTQGGRSFTGVLKDNDMYMKLTAEDKASYGQLGLTCDWLLFEGEENETTSSGAEGSASGMTSVDTTSYTAPNVKWSCQAGVFGEEKFATPGNACTGEDLANAMFPSGGGQ